MGIWNLSRFTGMKSHETLKYIINIRDFKQVEFIFGPHSMWPCIINAV